MYISYIGFTNTIMLKKSFTQNITSLTKLNTGLKKVEMIETIKIKPISMYASHVQNLQ